MATVGKVITCRAPVCWKFKTPVTIETIEVQPPGYGEVRIKMVATGLCHSDITLMEGTQSIQPVPFISGHEGSGIVESIGEGVTSVKPGDKVFTMFLPNCQKCAVCKDGRSNMCLDPERKEKLVAPLLRCSGFDGTPRFSCKGKTVYFQSATSSFAEYTVTPENSVVKVDPRTPLEKACIIACGFSTGYGSATNSVSIRPGDTTAVWGIGGVGLAAIVGLKEKGAGRIIGIDLNPEKEAIARKMGCTDFVCPKNVKKPLYEHIQEMTGGGVHFAFVCIGITKVMETAVLSTCPGGTAVLIGLTGLEDMISVSPLFLLADRKIVGSTIGCYQVREDIPKIVNKYLEGKIKIDDFITGYYKLDQIQEAIQLMQEGKTIRSIILF